MAAPVWLDVTIDPNERQPNSCFLGDPRVVNNGPVGLARFTTLRSWLSQWSYDQSNANGIADAANMSLPTLVISNGADDACTPSHARRLFDAVANGNKELVVISGATHYYLGQHVQLHQAEQTCTEWLRKQGLTDV
jgi:alpha-beta hydrolase superfamily lysophospholipase